jgi:hypothetical protein
MNQEASRPSGAKKEKKEKRRGIPFENRCGPHFFAVRTRQFVLSFFGSYAASAGFPCIWPADAG